MSKSAQASDLLRNAICFTMYVLLGVSQSFVIKASQLDGQYNYNPALAIVVSEIVKLGIASGCYFFADHVQLWWARRNGSDAEADEIKVTSFTDKCYNIRTNLPCMRYLWIPAFLYLIYNLLFFFNLQLVAPGTFRILLSSKIMWTGLLVHFLFGKRLTRGQWMALLVLTVACVVERSHALDIGGIWQMCSVLFQASLSSAASCYFQYILEQSVENDSAKSAESKDRVAGDGDDVEMGLLADEEGNENVSEASNGGSVGASGGDATGTTVEESSANPSALYLLKRMHPMQKNMFLYFWGIVFNTMLTSVLHPEALSLAELGKLTSFFPAISVLLQSFAGFAAGVFMLYMSVMLKEYANFVEMLCSVFGQSLFFNVPLRVVSILAALLGTASAYLYKHKDMLSPENVAAFREKYGL